MSESIILIGAIAAAMTAIGVFLGWAFRQIRKAGKFVEALYTILQREFPKQYGSHDGCNHGQSTQERVECIHRRQHEMELLWERHIEKAEAMVVELVAKVPWTGDPPKDTSLR